jgi:hypothetical protein
MPSQVRPTKHEVESVFVSLSGTKNRKCRRGRIESSSESVKASRIIYELGATLGGFRANEWRIRWSWWIISFVVLRLPRAFSNISISKWVVSIHSKHDSPSHASLPTFSVSRSFGERSKRWCVDSFFDIFCHRQTFLIFRSMIFVFPWRQSIYSFCVTFHGVELNFRCFLCSMNRWNRSMQPEGSWRFNRICLIFELIFSRAMFRATRQIALLELPSSNSSLHLPKTRQRHLVNTIHYLHINTTRELHQIVI